MPFIPYSTQPEIETNQDSPVQKRNIIQSIFPQASDYLWNLYGMGKETTGQIGDIFRGQFGTQEEKQLAGKSFIERQKRFEEKASNLGYEKGTPTGKSISKAFGAAGEIAPFFYNIPSPVKMSLPSFPGSQFISKAIEKTSPMAIVGGGSGITHGITTPDATIEERVKKGVSEGVSGAVGGVALSGAVELLKPISNLFKSAGISLTRRMIQPEVGTSPGWAERSKKATETLLEKTRKYDITPSLLDNSIVKALNNTTKEIKTHLGKIKENFWINKIDDMVNENLKKDITGYGSSVIPSKLKKEMGSEISRLNSVLSSKSKNIYGKSGVNALQIFEAKQEVGKILREPGGAFYKMARNQPLDRIDQVGLSYYNTLKNVVDDISRQYSTTGLNISALTEMESRLMQASSGVNALGEKPIGKISAFAYEKLPVIALILSIFETAGLTVGRGLYEGGKVSLKGLENENLPKILRTIISAESARLKEDEKNK